MAIKFTRHALEKFDLLARHSFVVTRDQVIAALLTPDQVETDRDPPIAQKQFDDRHVLRIVFRVEGDDLVVVTFYREGDDSMKISYDRDEDILMIELSPAAPIDYAEQTGSVIIHLDREQHPVLLEILRASEFMSGTVKASMRAEPVIV